MRKAFLGAVCVLAVVATACSETAAPPADTAAQPAATAAGGQASASKASAPAASPAPAPRPKVREVTIPAGTTLSLALDTDVSSKDSKVEDAVRAKLTKAVVIDGRTALPAGAELTGSIFEAQDAGRVKGRAIVSFGFDRLRSGKEAYTLHTAKITREAEGTKGKDAAKIGIGAGAGAVIGAIAGGKKGAAIGTAVGAGAGTVDVLATKGEEVRLPVGTEIEATLEQPLKIQVPVQ